jgi:hypothetical protein
LLLQFLILFSSHPSFPIPSLPSSLLLLHELRSEMGDSNPQSVRVVVLLRPSHATTSHAPIIIVYIGSCTEASARSQRKSSDAPLVQPPFNPKSTWVPPPAGPEVESYLSKLQLDLTKLTTRPFKPSINKANLNKAHCVSQGAAGTQPRHTWGRQRRIADPAEGILDGSVNMDTFTC